MTEPDYKFNELTGTWELACINWSPGRDEDLETCEGCSEPIPTDMVRYRYELGGASHVQCYLKERYRR